DEIEPICTKCGGPLIYGTRVCPRCMNKADVLLRLFHVSKTHWKMILSALIIMVLMSTITLTGPYFQRLLVDGALQPPAGKSPDMTIFIIAITGMILSLVLSELMGLARGRIMAIASSRVAADLRRL